jgi:hypothetical protein
MQLVKAVKFASVNAVILNAFYLQLIKLTPDTTVDTERFSARKGKVPYYRYVERTEIGQSALQGELIRCGGAIMV